jgi:hypothetical protein
MSADFVFSAHMDTSETPTKKPPDHNDSHGNPNKNQQSPSGTWLWVNKK